MFRKIFTKRNSTKRAARPNQRSRPFSRSLFFLVVILVLGLLVSGCSAVPGVSLTVDGQSPEPKQVTSGVQLLVLMTVLSLAPSVLILATSFTRIVIVLSMVRTAIGTQSAPPNQVIIGLSLLLTFFIMAPVYKEMDETAIQPYLNNQM